MAQDPAPVRRPDRRGLIGPFSGAQLGAALVAVAIAALVLMVISAPIDATPPTAPPVPGSTQFALGTPTAGLQPGQQAPELSGTVDGEEVGLVDLSGQPVRLSDFRGRPVWLNFWASWCPPCQEETPVLREMHERYADDGLAIIGVSVQESSPEEVRRYVDTYDLDYTVGFDATSAVFQTYRAYGLPTQFFIDRDGVIQSVYHGPVNTGQAREILEGLIDRGSLETSS